MRGTFAEQLWTVRCFGRRIRGTRERRRYSRGQRPGLDVRRTGALRLNMCGRYTLAKAEATKAALERLGIEIAKEASLPTRYNVAPTQTMPIVRGCEKPELIAMRWGSNWRDKNKVVLSINARSEKSSYTRFKDAVQGRRCLVPADGFYRVGPDLKHRPCRTFSRQRAEAHSGLRGHGRSRRRSSRLAILSSLPRRTKWWVEIHDRAPCQQFLPTRRPGRGCNPAH